MRNIAIVVAVLAATLGASNSASAENAAGHGAVSAVLAAKQRTANAAGSGAVSAVLARQKQMEQIGRAAGRAGEAAHNSTAWIESVNRNNRRPCYIGWCR